MTPSRAFLATALLVSLATHTPRALAQRAAGTTVLEVDAIGPRSGASVRAALRAHLVELERCRGEDDALVRVGFAIAPGGAVLEARAVDDPDLDREATECVIAILRGWQLRGRAAAVTAVSWSLRLRGHRAAEGSEEGDARALRACFCFHWVHGGDHGRTCEPTRARCVSARRSTDRDATECARRELPACDREAWIDGQHHVQP
jgi:hypothetical protein